MKLLTILTGLALSTISLAQDKVILNAKEITINSSEAIIVRNAQTPKRVKLNFNVAMSQSVCQAYSTRVVVVTSGSQCGYDQVITGYTTRTVCIQYNRQTNQCVRYQTERIPVVQNYPRTCPVTETYCSSYGTITTNEPDQVKIKFKNLPILGGTEEETFLVKARQRSYDGANVVYEIKPLQTTLNYDVKSRGIFGFDSYVIQPKK